MPIQNMVVKAVPTSYTVTGGTTITLGSMIDFAAAMLYAAADLDFRTRRTFKFDFKLPKVSKTAPNGYTQQRSTSTYIAPKVLANGKTTGQGFDLGLHWDVEATDAEKVAIMDSLTQMSLDPAWRAAVKAGSPNA